MVTSIKFLPATQGIQAEESGFRSFGGLVNTSWRSRCPKPHTLNLRPETVSCSFPYLPGINLIPTTAQWQTSTCHSHTVSKNPQDYWILTDHNSKGTSYEVACRILVSPVSCQHAVLRSHWPQKHVHMLLHTCLMAGVPMFGVPIIRIFGVHIEHSTATPPSAAPYVIGPKRGPF